MKKFICAVLVICMVFTFFSCGKKDTPVQEDVLGPAETVEAFMKALKARDLKTAGECYAGKVDSLYLFEEDNDPLMADILPPMVEKLLDFDYSVSNEQINGKSATVDLMVTTYDMGAIMSSLINAVLEDSSALAIMGLDQDDLEAEIAEILTYKFNEVMQTATKDYNINVTINLTKKDGRWVIGDQSKSEEFMNALSGGLVAFAESLDDIFG